MAWDRRTVEAKLAIGAIYPEDFPNLAIEALEAGIDGPVTRRIAGMIRPTGFEVDPYRSRFMAETGLGEMDREIAAVRLAQDLAREILRSGKDPLLFTGAFERLWTVDYAGSLAELGTLDDQVYQFGENKEAAREFVRECLVKIAEAPDAQ